MKKVFLAQLLLIILSTIHLSAQSITLYKNKVMDFFQAQQYEEVINYLSPFLSQDSNNIELLGLLGYAYYSNDDSKSAKKYFEKIFNLDSNNVSAIQYLANIENRKSPETSKALTYRLIHLQSSKAIYYKQLAELYRRETSKDSALFYYAQAYQLSPENTKIAAGFADILIETKNFSKADSILKIGLEKDSMNISFLELRINSAYQAKDYQSAIIPGERLLKMEGPFPTSLTRLASCYYNLKKYDDCVRICEFLNDQDASSETTFYYEASALSKLKVFEKSNELLEKCLALAISNRAETYYYTLGGNYDGLKQYKKSIAQYDTAYYLFKDPLMLYNCGIICETKLHNESLAKKYYGKYIEMAKPKTEDEKKAYNYARMKWKGKLKK